MLEISSLNFQKNPVKICAEFSYFLKIYVKPNNYLVAKFPIFFKVCEILWVLFQIFLVYWNLFHTGSNSQQQK